MLRRNVQHWFLCGLFLGVMIGLALGVAYGAVIVANLDFRAYPALLTAIVCGGACYLLKRDGHTFRGEGAGARYCFISKERKARIEDLL